jgi:hypothetical protein
MRSIIEHLFLPPKLPQEGNQYGDDFDGDTALLQLVADAAENFRNRAPEELQDALSIIVNMLQRSKQLKARGPLSNEEIQKSICEMVQHGKDAFVAVRIY